MAIRMHLPADINPNPDAKFWRGMAEAFPFDPKLTNNGAALAGTKPPWPLTLRRTAGTEHSSHVWPWERPRPASASINAVDIKPQPAPGNAQACTANGWTRPPSIA